MKTVNKLEIEISEKELNRFIAQKVEQENPGFKVERIEYETKHAYDESDWQGVYPPSTEFSHVEVTMVKKE